MNIAYIFLWLIFFIPVLHSYGEPVTLNLGYTNILEGGPIKPTHGLSITQYFSFYHSDKFLNNAGKPLDNIVPGPNFNVLYSLTQFLYQAKNKRSENKPTT